MTSKITLQCVKEGKKLRIKFFSFTNDEGKTFTNVYNNSLNCMFPRDIRVEGRFYDIGPNDLDLVNQAGKAPFYRVAKAGIKIRENFDPASLKLFPVEECVICMSDTPALAFAPCGHLCTCAACWSAMSKTTAGKSCPLCRRGITTVVTNQDLATAGLADLAL
jgi:hypothetical protein